jgi:chemotaxis protein histidine kinase CheA
MPMTDGQNQFLEKMKLIKMEYETHLPGKINDILVKWQNVKGYGCNREIVMDIYTSIHKLTGSSGIMGYKQISEICSKIEDNLQSALETNEPLNTKEFEQMDRYIQELKAFK